MAKLRFCSAVLVAVLCSLFFGASVYAQQDITPPSLLDVRFEPETIDTSKGPATITVTVHVTDDLSGVDRVTLFFRKPDTTQSAQVSFRHIVWGDEPKEPLLEGRLSATMKLPQYSAYGEWEMYSVTLVDNVGNRIDLSRPSDPDEAARGTDQWPVLFNGFAFAVGQSETPQEPVQPARQLFIPSVSAN